MLMLSLSLKHNWVWLAFSSSKKNDYLESLYRINIQLMP